MVGALAMTLLVFLILPFTQLFSNVSRDILELRRVEVVLPPPPPPPPKPPPEEKKPEEKPELQEKPKPLTLSQLEVALNVGTGGALEGDFGLGFGLVPNAIEEMKIFELSEVDKEPQLVYQAEVNYPMKLLRERVGGSVTILFVVDESGSVRDARVKQTTGVHELEKAAMDAVMKYKFTPGIKDGQPVRTWFEIPMTFAPPR